MWKQYCEIRVKDGNGPPRKWHKMLAGANEYKDSYEKRDGPS